MTTIELLRWNVKGISNKTKRYKIITHLKSMESDVAMLQVTHLKNTEAVNPPVMFVCQEQQWCSRVNLTRCMFIIQKMY